MRAPFRGILVVCAASIWFGAAGSAAAHSSSDDRDLEGELRAQNEQRIRINRAGMGALMGWAGLNMAVGTAGYATASGRRKYFHQANAVWNVVNAALAAGGLMAAANEVPGDYGLVETVRRAEAIEKLLLVNAGLDVGYVAVGAFLRERGARVGSQRLRGYGDALLLQGGFLFAFDAVLYGVHRSNTADFYETVRPVFGPNAGVSVRISF